MGHVWQHQVNQQWRGTTHEQSTWDNNVFVKINTKLTGQLNTIWHYTMNGLGISLKYLHNRWQKKKNKHSFNIKSFQCSYWETVLRGHVVSLSTILRDLGTKEIIRPKSEWENTLKRLTFPNASTFKCRWNLNSAMFRWSRFAIYLRYEMSTYFITSGQDTLRPFIVQFWNVNQSGLSKTKTTRD